MVWKQLLCCLSQRMCVLVGWVGMVGMGLCFFAKEGWCSPPTSKPFATSKSKAARFRVCWGRSAFLIQNRRWNDAEQILVQCLCVVEEKEHQSSLWFRACILAKRIQRLSLAFFFTGERSR